MSHDSVPRTSAPPETATAHCTIIGLDIEGFGRPDRSNTHRLRIRKGLYQAVRNAFDAVGIAWVSCRHEDLGDGVLILVPADIPKPLFVDELPETLTDQLRQYNASRPRQEKMRLRLAVHAGEISYDDHGFTGASIIHTFRLLDAPELKATLAANAALLAMVSSAWFFDEVIRHSEHSNSGCYRRTDITNKETTTQGWIRLVPARRNTRPRIPARSTPLVS
ncbi:hypothetical protein ACIOD2_41595 [Amycolatopsis sp. NPDC088138]|uniref:hypothetical protein n=1 Tax=Amycolatopsis sp. NPDC088138 TaxID=3363938 RepID=UPI0038087536